MAPSGGRKEKSNSGLSNRIVVGDHANLKLSGRNGVGYITKCLGEKSELGGDVYESSKFGGGHCALMLSHSAEKVIRREAIRQRGR